MVNLRPWFDYSQVTGITKLGTDYFVSSQNRIVRVTIDGAVSDVAQNGKSIEGLTNDGTSRIVADFSAPNPC
jgi:hypothetical protein